MQWSVIGKKSLERCSLPMNRRRYMLHDDVVRFTVQGLRDALTAAEYTVTDPLYPADE